MNPPPPFADDLPPGALRRQRQRAEILGLVADDQLHRAADLAHHYLVEFPRDRHVRHAVAIALGASLDPAVRSRASEFVE